MARPPTGFGAEPGSSPSARDEDVLMNQNTPWADLTYCQSPTSIGYRQIRCGEVCSEAALRNLWPNVKYALRQFRLAPLFTASAVLTLALGIGGTTAIFTLIHAVMLRSLPVGDPAMLYRVGEGNDCCVNGSLQDKWGMYSFDLYQQLKVATPEFESVTAFQAGDWRMSALRVGAETSPRPLNSEFVTGSYFSTLGVKAFGGRPITSE